MCASTYDASGKTSTIVSEESCSRRRSSSREIPGMADESAALSSEGMISVTRPSNILADRKRTITPALGKEERRHYATPERLLAGKREVSLQDRRGPRDFPQHAAERPA